MSRKVKLLSRDEWNESSLASIAEESDFEAWLDLYNAIIKIKPTTVGIEFYENYKHWYIFTHGTKLEKSLL